MRTGGAIRHRYGFTKDNGIVSTDCRTAHPCDFVNRPSDDSNWVTLTH